MTICRGMWQPMDLTLLHVMIGVGSPWALHGIWTSDPDSTVKSLGALVKTGVTDDVKTHVNNYSVQPETQLHLSWHMHMMYNMYRSYMVLSSWWSQRFCNYKVNERARGICESSRSMWIGLFKELYLNILTPKAMSWVMWSSEETLKKSWRAKMLHNHPLYSCFIVI